MYFYLTIALQVFCIYHLYKNRNDYYWYFVIIFLPVLGCLIYIITQVYSRRDTEKITSEIATIINPTKKVKDLERILEFSETFQNRVNLADAYLEIGDFINAKVNYLKAQEDNFKIDLYVAKQLIECFYKLNNYKEVVTYSKNIRDHIEFKKSSTQFYYGLSLKELGEIEEAETQLRVLDQRYSNYNERVALAKFLIEIDKKEDAQELLNEIYAESKNMTRPNRNKYRFTIIEVENLLKTV
ncbi:hypothetical protein [Pontimicrobium sp. SW4]|uniref:Cardiolipin synthase N-terminal domain-containing protein n=1 Tax=Pontimicrobium sp. SW4 TaxID=3153519 RepID=A0AAU7BPF3_9FLAO